MKRFLLLQAHYTSDIERLNGIKEAGSTFSALSTIECPVCGSEPQHQNIKKSCEGNVDVVVTAAEAEISKIEKRNTELIETIGTLEKEKTILDKKIPRLQHSMTLYSEELHKTVSPNLRKMRASYQDLTNKKTKISESLAIHTTVESLTQRKTELEPSDGGNNKNREGATTSELPTSIADKFAQTAESILRKWNFPKLKSVQYDLKNKDLIISGKNRTAYGKGLRAITQACFTIAAGQQHENRFDHAATVRMSWRINPAHNTFLERVQLESVWMSVGRCVGIISRRMP